MKDSIFEALQTVYADSSAAVTILDPSFEPLWSNEAARRLRPTFFRAGAFDAPGNEDLLRRLEQYGAVYYRSAAFPAVSDNIILIKSGDYIVAMADVTSGLPVPDGTVDIAGIDTYTQIVRNGIDNITLSSQSIERMVELDNADVDYMFRNIRRASYKLLRNTQNATLLSKYLTGTLQLSRRDCNLSDLCATLCLAAQSVCKKPVPIHFTGPPQDIYSSVDVRLAERAILNVLLNAMAYTRDGNEIDVTLGQQAGQIVLSVKDRGAGIGAQHLPYVKEPYFSVSPEGEDEPRPGLGLGLPIAAVFCHQHGGTLLIDSKAGEGTTAVLSIKRTPPAEGDIIKSSIADYVTDAFSPVYVELSDICEIPG